MVIKVYVALISCSQEVKKNQQRAVMILESKNIPYVAIDITDPEQEEGKDYMQANSVPKPNAKVSVTPQIFNEADYCGDFEELDMSNECDNLGDFLKLNEEEKKGIKIGITGILPADRQKAKELEAKMTNGVTTSREDSPSKQADENPAIEESTTLSAESAPTEAEKIGVVEDSEVVEDAVPDKAPDASEPQEDSLDNIEKEADQNETTKAEDQDGEAEVVEPAVIEDKAAVIEDKAEVIEDKAEVIEDKAAVIEDKAAVIEDEAEEDEEEEGEEEEEEKGKSAVDKENKVETNPKSPKDGGEA